MESNHFNPFAPKQDSHVNSQAFASKPFGSPSLTPQIGFGAPSQGMPSNTTSAFAPSQPATQSSLGASSQHASTSVNPFGAPSQTTSIIAPASNPFAKTSQPASSVSTGFNPFSKGPTPPSTNSSPFGVASTATTSNLTSFNTPSPQPPSSAPSSSSPFGGFSGFSKLQSAPTLSGPANNHLPTTSTNVRKPGSYDAGKSTNTNSSLKSDSPARVQSASPSTMFSQPVQGLGPAQTPKYGSPASTNTSVAFGKSDQKGSGTASSKNQFQKTGLQSLVSKPAALPDALRSSETLAKKVNEVLKRERLSPPKWPGFDAKDKRPVGQHEKVKKYWNDYRDYQGKVRTSLIRAGVIDDPEVPKRLSEAIDFKGTCEQMCPDWEKVDRIISGRVDDAEKELLPDGSVSRYPSLEKMVKALARSAAGQEAPLPDEVRSAAALRKTVDYLFSTVLADSDLPTVYTFLWDRTRAIRRDFVFHSFMGKSELLDQVYCLELITRFHVIAAHQMSRDGVNSQGFSEQQELEQLGKSLLSLIHAYEDCSAQGIECENETEFRAYYILWGARSNPSILEEVQNWGWKFWGESEIIQLAVSLVEALQTPWDTLPLKPRAETDTAHNAFARFFSIIENQKVSYTMACFAETFFNHVRVSILKTILKSYRKQRDQTRDWTISKLNQYLRFDHEDDIVPFCEQHSLNIGEADGVEYLSFEFGDEVTQPSPPLKQGYSETIVERKRGLRSLSDAINKTVYEDSDQGVDRLRHDDSDEGGLFVKDDSVASSWPPPAVVSAEKSPEITNGHNRDQPIQLIPDKHSSVSGITSKPTSILDGISYPQAFSNPFGIPAAIVKPDQQSAVFTAPSPVFQPLLTNPTPSIFAKQPGTIMPSLPQPAPTELPKTYSTSSTAAPFAFLQTPSSQPIVETLMQSTHTIGSVENQRLETPIFPSLPTTPSIFQSHIPAVNVNPSSTLTLQPELAAVQPPPFPIQLAPDSARNQGQSVTIEAALESSTECSVETPQIDATQLVATDSLSISRPSKVAAIAEWVALGNDGLVDQFMASQVELICHEAARIYMEEEAQRTALEAARQAHQQADDFRWHSLATRYGRRWRENARLLWLRRRGKAARQARRDLAESMRASKMAQSVNMVEDFRASTTSRRRGSLESIFDGVGIIDNTYSSETAIRATRPLHHPELEPPPAQKRQHSERSTSSTTSSMKRHKRGQSEQQNPLRRSLLSDPTYLYGGSRIHYIPDYDSKKESRLQVSGVMTDYFRLKARGISTLADGSPLAKTATHTTVHKKRSFDAFIKPSPTRQSKVTMLAQSAPNKSSRSFANSSEDIRALKVKAKVMMEEDQKSHQKRVYVDDEEELFERAKRVREQMDEGANWYRKEIERDTVSRSVS